MAVARPVGQVIFLSSLWSIDLTLILGDAVRLLRSVPDGSVDLIVTDPPYRTISGGNSTPGGPVGILAENDGKIFEHNDLAFDDYLPSLFRVLTDPGHMYMMVNFLNLEAGLAAVRRAGFDIHGLLTWQKNNALPNRWYMKNQEHVIFARKGSARTIYTPGVKQCVSVPNLLGGGRNHPTEKPIELMKIYINASSRPGDVVLDPFMGSGSTGVAALHSGRRFIGMEIDAEYYNRAVSRCDARAIYSASQQGAGRSV